MAAIYKTATGCNNISAISVQTNHGASYATAQVECTSISCDIGDAISIDIGYVGDHSVIFTGYVKQIVRTVERGLYTVTASDVMTRAVDYFIVPSSPTGTITKSNITAEDLVSYLLVDLAGISSFSAPVASSFTFATTSPMEIKLVSSYDLTKTICDLLAWTVYASPTGTVYFKNRKPYVMDGTSGQPGDVADTVSTATITDSDLISITSSRSNIELRNRVVVQGSGDIYASASEASSYLPGGFYKTVFFSDYQLITTQSDAQKAADYNLNMLKRLTERCTIEMIGDSNYNAYNCMKLNSSLLGGGETTWYIFSSAHNISTGGYTTTLELRK